MEKKKSSTTQSTKSAKGWDKPTHGAADDINYEFESTPDPMASHINLQEEEFCEFEEEEKVETNVVDEEIAINSPKIEFHAAAEEDDATILDAEMAKRFDQQKLETLNKQERNELRTLLRASTKKAVYGGPFNERLVKDLEDDSGGLIWRAKVYRNDFKHPKLVLPDGSIKPRRPIASVFEDDFFSSITFSNGKYVFQGQLNAWPALTNLELVALEYWYSRKAGPKSVTISRRFWTNKNNLKKDNKPSYPTPGRWFFKTKPMVIRATLRAPKFTEVGYSANNPGFVFWFKPFRSLPIPDGGPKMAHGINIVKALEYDNQKSGDPIPRAVRAHFYAHRYAKVSESPKDKITYHTGVLLEWDHGQYCTNVELAYLFGLGGYGGKSNWIDDRDSPRPLLWSCMSDSIKAPWISSKSEVRMTDMKVKSVEEFEAFLRSHEGPKGRFMKPRIKYSGTVRLSMNSATDIARYLVNYTARDNSYSEEFRNCQSFAADFFSFLCAKTKVEPLYPIKMFYKERRHLFLYDFNQFESKKIKKSKSQSKRNNREESVNSEAAKDVPMTKRILNKILG